MPTKEGVYLIEKKIVPPKPRLAQPTLQNKPRKKQKPYSVLYDSYGIPIIKLFYGHGPAPHTYGDGNISRLASLDMILRGHIRFPDLEKSHVSTVLWVNPNGYKQIENYLRSYPSGNIIITHYEIEIINKNNIVLDKPYKVLTIETILDSEKVPELIETPRIVDRVPTDKKVFKPKHTTNDFNQYLYKMLQATYRDFRKVFLPSR